MNKWFKITILPIILLLLLPLLPLRAVAAGESVTAKIPFLVRNAPGTVVIVADTEGAPMPNPSRIENVNKDAFEITFTEAGDYLYTVYQEQGTVPNIGYDTVTIYKVGFSVIYDSNDDLTCIMDISKAGSDVKGESILFENTPLFAYLDIVKLAKIDGEVIENVFCGNEFLYEIAIENLGGAPATNVTIIDTLPEEQPLLTVQTIYNNGVLSDDKKTISWTIPYIAPSERVSVSFTVLVPPVWGETSWINTAQAIYYGGFAIGGSTGSTTTATATASAAVTAPPPNVVIEKKQSLNGATLTKELIYVKPGDKVTYYLTMTNVSDTIAEDVIVTDAVPNPPLLILDEKSISHGGTVENDIITWELGDLESGASITVSFDVTIPEVNEHAVWVNTGFGSYSNVKNLRAREVQPDRVIMQSNDVMAEYLPENLPGTLPGGDSAPGASDTPGGESSGTPGDVNTPQTSDSNHLSLWIILLLGSLTGIVILLFMKKKWGNEGK